MDFQPRITSDGRDYGLEHGWLCNFNFGYGHDVIDEDAQSEKCCVQALELLIAEADAEIHDLEDELAILQCRLEWANSYEQKDPYEVCCAVFKQKISFLSSAIQSLRNGEGSSKYTFDETLEIQGPSDRISDIINALIRDKSLVPYEQLVVSNGKNLVVASVSVSIDIDLRPQATGMETNEESEEQNTVMERQPELTNSEESSSDAARYADKDSKEGRARGKSDVAVTRKAGVDACDSTSEGESGLVSLKHAMTLTHLQDSPSQGNSKSDVLGPGESEKCMTVSKIGKSSPSPLYMEVIVKTEENGSEIDNQHTIVDSAAMLQDHDRDYTVEDLLEIIENQSQSVAIAHITYSRKKSSLNRVLKPQRKKKQRKLQLDVGVLTQCTPSMTPEPPGQIGDRKSPSNAENSGPSCSPSSMIEERCPSLSKPISRRKVRNEEDIATSRVLGATKRHKKGAKRECASIKSPAEKISKGEVLDASEGLVSKPGETCQGAPQLAEAKVKDSVLASGCADPHAVGLEITMVEDPRRIESPAIDLENLRLNVSQGPDFLKKMKVPELKEIAKLIKMRGCSKLKKDKIIEELTKRLGSA